MQKISDGALLVFVLAASDILLSPLLISLGVAAGVAYGWIIIPLLFLYFHNGWKTVEYTDADNLDWELRDLLADKDQHF